MPRHTRQLSAAALLVGVISTTATVYTGQDEYFRPLDPGLAADLQSLFDSERDRLRRAFRDVEPALLRADVDCATNREPLRNPRERVAVNGVLDTRLRVSYAEHQICSPAHQREITVRVRSYEGGLVGPTLRVQPGTLLRVRLQNDLPRDASHSTGSELIDPSRSM